MYVKMALGAIRRALERLTRPDRINGYEMKRYSQNGEDGILREIFRRIGTTNRFFVEFGVETGIECNAALLVRADGWNGVFIEGSLTPYERLEANYAGFGVRCLHEFITAENVVEVFVRASVPTEFDLLSIDIDGNDYWVWERLTGYAPRVVVVEFNATRGPVERWVMRYNPRHIWNGNGYWGASLASLEALGEKKGYTLIGTDEKGVNTFFLRSDLLSASGFTRLSAYEAYHASGYGAQATDGPHVDI